LISCSAKLARKDKSETEEWIPVVHNPKNPVSPLGTPSKLIVTEELCIGNKEEHKDLMSPAIRDVQLDNEGNIYVLDFRKSHVVVFNKDGHYLRTIGEKGKRKGKLSYPLSMSIFERKGIMIYDDHANYYSLDGEFLDRIYAGKYKDTSPKLDSRGNFIGALYSRDPKREIRGGNLLRLDSNFKLIAVYGSFKERFHHQEWPRLKAWFTFQVRIDDSVIWAIRSNYELHIHDSSGKKIRKIIKEYNPIRITDEDKKEMMNEVLDSMTSGRNPFTEGSLEFPEVFPPIHRIACDDEGRIYVQTYEKDENGRIYHDVFDPEGRYITKFSLSRKETIHTIKGNLMYTMMQGSKKRNSLVKRYKMVWE
jgi:hypothetical protein